jgi:hypothetical protein
MGFIKLDHKRNADIRGETEGSKHSGRHVNTAKSGIKYKKNSEIIAHQI